jgi:N6-L-threonylcarbamoyladenine synthase
MYTLGIETSCDETSCAILKNYNVLSNITLSSLREHKKYGGVIPEIASRAHLKNIDKVLKLTQEKSGISLEKIELIAVTSRPGLIGALLVGLNFAKALSLALKIPFIGINHLHAHLFAPFLNGQAKVQFPLLGAVISGGHTEFYLVNDFDKIKTIGRACDDACGEVFDKVAVNYNLGYPGGPLIDRLFKPEYKEEFRLKCGRKGFNLSFSGIKTALIYKKIEMEKKGLFDKKMKIKLLSSFQHTIMGTIISTIASAAERLKVKRVVLGGGVVANNHLRSLLKEYKPEMNILLAPLEYCGDNAAVVAGLGFYLYNRKGFKSNIGIGAEAN